MNYVLLKKIENNWFKTQDWNDEKLAGLASMLKNMIGTLIWEWLEGKYPNQNWAKSNAWGLIEHHNRVFVHFFINEDEKWDQNFNTTKENMLKIINNWVEIAIVNDNKPENILVYRDNDQDEIIKFKAISNPEDYSTF